VETAVHFFDSHFQGVAVLRGLGDDALDGGADEFRDAFYAMCGVESAQRLELLFREAQAEDTGFASDWHISSGKGEGLSLRGGSYPLTVDFNGDGALEQTHRGDQAECLLHFDDDAFNTRKRSADDADGLAGFQERVGEDGERRIHHDADCGDLGIGYGSGTAAEGENVDHAGALQNGNTVDGVQAAEDIAGKERDLDLTDTVGPAAARAYERDVFLIASGTEGGGGDLLELVMDVDGVPGEAAGNRCMTDCNQRHECRGGVSATEALQGDEWSRCRQASPP